MSKSKTKNAQDLHTLFNIVTKSPTELASATPAAVPSYTYFFLHRLFVLLRVAWALRWSLGNLWTSIYPIRFACMELTIIYK
jgi:hypothetical protein